MKYYLIAGEASGDLHGSLLIRALHQEDTNASVRCWGGYLMQAAGATLAKHYRELAFMGFWEVVKNLRTISANFDQCKQDITLFQPDVLILIDYPGFNLRMSKWAHRQGFRVFYYISPQLWAWHSSRVHIIKTAVERMYVILPFEKDFYQKHGVEVDYVGHPLLDVISKDAPLAGFGNCAGLSSGKPIVALLPGSRKQEVRRMLTLMLRGVADFPGYTFAIAGAPALDRSFYEPFLRHHPAVAFVENETYALLKNASAALVTSGTATLETALSGVPQVVCYKGNPLSYWLARRLVSKDLKYISLVNLIAGRQVVVELIQRHLTAPNLSLALKKLLEPETRKRMLRGYAELTALLGNEGASRRAARLMVERLSVG
ncbi:MAG: lipid-A-disaccharide synthase [Saprospiraceae bacterium]|nr:MAG: lipid-A-disaccharide synthase [Saprospiraceae bacterium]